MRDADMDPASAPVPPGANKRFSCAISGRERPRRDLVSLETLRPSLAERIRHDFQLEIMQERRPRR